MLKFINHFLIKAAAVALVMLLLYSPVSKAQIETGENIMESASQFAQMQYFNTLLEDAGLDEKLNGDGPYTVLAPTDEAFNELPDGVLEDLLENPDELQDILRAHISSGSFDSEALAGQDNFSTVEGTVFEIDHHERGISIDEALMVAADIIAINGVIHAIDTVLIP